MDEIIIGGGAAYHIEPELEIYFNVQPRFEPDPSNGRQIRTKKYSRRNYSKPAVSMVWGADIQEIVVDFFKLENEDKNFIAARILDCFGLFDYLLGSDRGS